MAISVYNKYVWLLDTVRKAGDIGITFDEINEEWMRKDNQRLNGGEKIPRRTFHKWRQAIDEMFNVFIDCRRKGGYRYFIADPDELKKHSMSNWLLDTMSVSNLLIENIALKDRILLENVPSGLKFLPVILDAMKACKVLSMTYQGFSHDEPHAYDVHPYCVKLFRQRWYLVAFSTARHEVRTYAVDRIKALAPQRSKFKMPENFSPASFFSNSYGVMMGSEMPQDIKISVDAEQANYLRSLPLHHSQHEQVRGAEHSVFTFHLCPEYDFIKELLSMGRAVEVIEPASLRAKVAAIAHEMSNMYRRKECE